MQIIGEFFFEVHYEVYTDVIGSIFMLETPWSIMTPTNRQNGSCGSFLQIDRAHPYIVKIWHLSGFSL